MRTFINLINYALVIQLYTAAQDKRGMITKFVSVIKQNAAVVNCSETIIIVNASPLMNVAPKMVIIGKITKIALVIQPKNAAKMTLGPQIHIFVHVLDVVWVIHI